MKTVKIGKFHILELIISGFMDFWVDAIKYKNTHHTPPHQWMGYKGHFNSYNITKINISNFQSHTKIYFESQRFEDEMITKCSHVNHQTNDVLFVIFLLAEIRSEHQYYLVVLS